MSKYLKFFYAMLIGVVALSLSSCSDDDDAPGYNPEQPIVGSWIVEEVTSPSYTSYIGGMLIDEEQWKQDFANKWIGKKLTFKAEQITDEVVWIQKYDAENPSKSDRDITFEVTQADETTLTTYYTELVYMRDGTRMCRTTARMTMKRK